MTTQAHTPSTDSLPSPKRTKLSKEENGNDIESSENEKLPPGFRECCLALLDTSADQPIPKIPASLTKAKTRNDLDKLRRVFDRHGFRTSVVMSPRPALSIYKDSCTLSDSATQVNGVVDHTLEGKAFLLAVLGLHTRQADMEHWYSTSIKKVYCLLLFCNLMRKLCPKAASEAHEDALLNGSENLCRSVVAGKGSKVEEASRIAALVPDRVAQLTKTAVAADPRLRVEQLEHEFHRIEYRNSTLSNAMLQLFLDTHDCCIREVYFKRSQDVKYERITVFLYDPEIDPVRPPRFTFLPAVQTLLLQGPEAIVRLMMESFWSALLRLGYFASKAIKDDLTPDLEKYFLSGIAKDPSIPLPLNAHFTPTYALSFYFVGKAGSGKSSLVRNFSPALNAAVEEHADPEILVRFVKQNLNKPTRVLELELELRPNNNDLSVMSIVQGRRMSLHQTKPGLVVVDLEEMASNDPKGNPNQLQTSRLLSQRFSGRNSDYQEGVAAPRNSTKRGISGDASIIALFTSNYQLEQPCADALKRLEMFQHIKQIKMHAIAGSDRRAFADAYLNQRVQDRISFLEPTSISLFLDIPLGEGDTRPLVRLLRMIAFYICALAQANPNGRLEGSVTMDGRTHLVVSVLGETMKLHYDSQPNLIPVEPEVFDERVRRIVKELRRQLDGVATTRVDDLAQTLDFYFANALAPAVVLSKNADLIHKLVRSIETQEKNVRSIRSVDVSNYKIMKSLYDPADTPNLRDDILKLGRGTLVVVELICSDRDDQLMIRELLEDSPSMTAFSTSKSALFKEGLLFCVYVADDITPEVLSRASLVV